MARQTTTPLAELQEKKIHPPMPCFAQLEKDPTKHVEDISFDNTFLLQAISLFESVAYVHK